ncbi:MAG: FAD-binding protein [Anaerohalosphaeraceae bacterium]|nr:FAD-binding protein [Anaerohalosphaeraceae bacterium]
MSNFIVLVKQVPDVTQITDNAFDPETGTLVRGRLASVINELDTCALAMAYRMKDISNSAGKIIALTMGPPMAAEVLRYSLARCADKVVLLTDRALGGADTWATANPLAFAIRKIVKELLGGSDDYYVVAGMQSVDGDTAQVPAQIASELEIPCIAYATDVEYNSGRFEFERIISRGSQVVSPKTTPAVITVAKYEYPLFASFAATRRANETELIQWTAADINAAAVGISGSKTRVIRVYPPGKTNRKCQKLDTPDALAKILKESFSKSDDSKAALAAKTADYILPAKRAKKFDKSFEGTQKENNDYQALAGLLDELAIKDVSEITEDVKEKILDSPAASFHKKALGDMLASLSLREPAYNGQVWVVAETNDGKIHPATFELLGKARHLADSLDTRVGVVIAGENVQSYCKDLIAAGADCVYTAEDKLLKEFDPASYSKVFEQIIGRHWPQIVLFAATPRGRVLAPMISYKLSCGLTADCTGLEIRDSSRKAQTAVLMQSRPALGGNVMATICTKDSKSQMASARSGVMKRLAPDPNRQGKTINEPIKITDKDISLDIIKTEMSSGSVNLAAGIIVSGGKGMQNRDNYEKLLATLSESLSKSLKTPAERGASRAAVEQGFVDRIHQVGQTGTSIGPKLYFALGISGAIQHMIGVANSEIIVAINSDPNAPIFRHCDYYINGTVEDVVPKLVKALA